MDYPYKYCLIVDYDDPYSLSHSQLYFCDFYEAESYYNFYVDKGCKCVLYDMLRFDNFDL